MDEARLRQQVCQAAHQLWIRGLITGDSGLVSVELHRRRFLATPPHARRPNLAPDDLVTVDLGGQDIQSALTPTSGIPGSSGGGGGTGGLSGAIPEALWRAHRAGYKVNLADAPPGPGRKPRVVTGVLLADPPMLLALMRLLPDDGCVELAGVGSVPIVGGHDEREITDALLRSPGVLVRGSGVVVASDHLGGALNWIERLDAAARAEFAAGGPCGRGGDRLTRHASADLPPDPPPELPLDEEEPRPV